jgi:hypothetical protein
MHVARSSLATIVQSCRICLGKVGEGQGSYCGNALSCRVLRENRGLLNTRGGPGLFFISRCPSLDIEHIVIVVFFWLSDFSFF